jgi:Flp pilus assembly protein protease CpaA
MEDLKNKWLWIVIAAVVVILIVAYAAGWIGG